MKKHLFLKTLLVLVGVLVTSLTIPAKAWYTITSDEDIYFDATDQYTRWELSSNNLYMKIYYGDNQSSSSIFQMTQITGSKLYYSDAAKGHSNVSGIEFFAGSYNNSEYTYNYGTGTIRFNDWTNVLNRLDRMCYTNSTSENWKWDGFINCPPLNTISLAKYNTTIYGGDGTSEHPYLVAAGSAVQVEVTSTKRSDNLTAHYKFTVNTTTDASYSTSATKTVIAAPVDGTTYAVSVQGWGYNNSSYSHNSITSNTVFFRGIASYQLTYSVGSVVGTDGSISTDPTTASGDYIQSGTSITLTAPAAKTGYTWSGWYTNAAGTEGKIEDTDRAIAVTMTADKTLYACYTEDTHTVSVTHTTGGTTTESSVSGVGIATASGEITATPANLAWRFKNWEIPDGVTIKTGSTTAATITINATADSKTINAVFEPKYGLLGSITGSDDPHGMPGWTVSESADFVVTSYTDKNTMSLTCARTLEPNTEYRFQVYDRQYTTYRSGNDDGTMAANSSWELTGSNKQIYYKTAGYGVYTFEITKINDYNQPSIHIIRPESKEIVFGTNDGTGGSVSCKTTENAVDYTIVTADSIRVGGTAVFTAVPNTGYTFDGWFSDVACTVAYEAGEDVAIDDVAKTLTLSNIAADKTVYAKFSEVMTTVKISANDDTKGTITVGGEAFAWGNTIDLGITTTKVLAVTPTAGYYLTGWNLTNCTRTDGGAEDATTITIRSNGTNAAAFVEANIEEDLRTPYQIKGGTGLTGNNWEIAYDMTKKTGYSTESVAYYTFAITGTNTSDDQVDNYGFKIVKGGTLYGLPADGASYWWTRETSGAQTLSSDGKNIQIRADIIGSYEVKVDYSDPNSPTVTVTFPPKTPPTAVDNTGVSKKAVKRIVDGQLVIEREGKLYNALGAEVK